jgi:hypothetical protein
MYGHRLWFFKGAKVKGVLKSLTSMQWKAACWITGAFCTSPTGGVESLAGLPPIRLHLQKLSQRAILRTATLSDTHPLQSLIKGTHAKRALPMLGSACWMSETRCQQVHDTITMSSGPLDELSEEFSPCAEENSPGFRLMDRYLDRVLFNDYNPKEENAASRRRNLLNSIYTQARASYRTVCCRTDCSVSNRTNIQAKALFVIERAGLTPYTCTWVAGRVLPANVELFAIRMAVSKATMLENCNRIVIFTDSLALARKAVDPSVHSGQAYSLAVCKALTVWLSGMGDRAIEFVQAPSKLQWGLQDAAHTCARNLPPVPTGRRPATLDYMRRNITQSTLNSWTTVFQDERYCGSQFLQLRDMKGNTLTPTYTNGGTWLKLVGEETKICTRICRAILNHAPMGIDSIVSVPNLEVERLKHGRGDGMLKLGVYGFEVEFHCFEHPALQTR